jgi:hypothetical protein
MVLRPGRLAMGAIEKGLEEMDKGDIALTRMVRGQVARRYIDASLLDVRVSHGIVHLSGVIRVLRTHKDLDLKKEMDTISVVLRTKQGVRDVVWEVTQRS